MSLTEQNNAPAAGITMTWGLTFRPGVADRFWADILTSLEGTRSFPGCVRANMYRNRANPDRVMLYSEWKSHQDYQAYSAWRAGTNRLIAGVSGSELPSLLAYSSAREFWNVRA